MRMTAIAILQVKVNSLRMKVNILEAMSAACTMAPHILLIVLNIQMSITRLPRLLDFIIEDIMAMKDLTLPRIRLITDLTEINIYPYTLT